MLGKGLESLIPPQKPQDDAGEQSDQNPQGVSAQPVVFSAQPAVSDKPVSESDTQVAKEIPVVVNNVSEDAKPQFAGEDFNSGMAGRDFSGNKAATVSQKNDFVAASVSEPKVSKKPVQADSVFHIEVEKIKPNPAQPRKVFDEKALWELAHSIREFGFLQPLVVSKIEKETPTGVDVEYQLIAGHRRLLAAKLLGLLVVPAIIRNVGLEIEKLELAVVENIQRENLNSIERARAMARLQDEFNMTQREIASKLGKSREAVANTVRLLDLPTYIQEALEKGEITESHGRFLLAVQDPAAQKRLFDDLVANRLTTRDLKNRVRLSKAPSVQEEISPEFKMMEEKLSSEFGTPVKIERSANNGKITITFYSDEELQSILNKMGLKDAG